MLMLAVYPFVHVARGTATNTHWLSYFCPAAATLPTSPGVALREAGLATHFVRSSDIAAIEAALVALGPQAADLSAVARVLDGFEDRETIAQKGECE